MSIVLDQSMAHCKVTSQAFSHIYMEVSAMLQPSQQ